MVSPVSRSGVVAAVVAIATVSCGGETNTSQNSAMPSGQGASSTTPTSTLGTTSTTAGGATSATVPGPGDTGATGPTGSNSPGNTGATANTGASGASGGSGDVTGGGSAATSEAAPTGPAGSNTVPTEPADTGSESQGDSRDTTEPSDFTGTCTASKAAGNGNTSGSGPFEVTIETNADPGVREGTIFRPKELTGDEVFPILVWGQGGCSLNGLSNSDAMVEIASHGYFVIADGTPNGSGSRNMDSNNVPAMGEPLLAYVDWAIAENSKPCSAYYRRLDTSKIAANGFSCGGLMAEGTAGDPRITTWGITSSGMFSVNRALYDSIHTPVLIVLGGASDIAYENGKRDYDNISQLDVPVLLFSKDIGHGGDLFQRGGGDFTKINLAWLNWWLKGDEGATGKGVLVGAGCSYCSNAAWEVASANVP